MSPDPTLKKGTFSSCRNSTAICKKIRGNTFHHWSEHCPCGTGQVTEEPSADQRTRHHMSTHLSVQGTPRACSGHQWIQESVKETLPLARLFLPQGLMNKSKKGCDLRMTQKPGRESDWPSEVSDQKEDTESYQEGQMEQSVSWPDLWICSWPFQTLNCEACKKLASHQSDSMNRVM